MRDAGRAATLAESRITAAEAGTLYGLLRLRAERSGAQAAFMQHDAARRTWTSLDWSAVRARTDRMADALAALGVEPGARVAVLLKNGLDWVCFDMAGHRLGLPVVGLYTNDTAVSAAQVIADARPSVLLVDTAERWAEISARLEDAGFVREVWIAARGAARDGGSGPGCIPLADVLARAVPPCETEMTDPDAIAALVYTSGTTGTPKGVMLSHRAILENADAVARVVPPLGTDLFLSILPLAHAFERTMGYILPITVGARVAHAPSLLQLRRDLPAVRPTVIIGVPRFYEKIFDAVQREADASPVRRWLLAQTARIGWALRAEGLGLGRGPSVLDRLAWPLLRRLVGRRVLEAFGGRLRVAVSGGARLDPSAAQTLIGLGLPLVEGYGLSEAGPVVTATRVEDYLPGSVGRALPGLAAETREDGELIVRTPCRMAGYWRRPEETAATIDPSGALHTGDLAEIRDGRVWITGRCKNVLVLSNGENVNPEPIESAILDDPLFVQCCVIGDRRAFISALVVVDQKAWRDAVSAGAAPAGDPGAEAAQPLLLKRIRGRLKDHPAHHQVRACIASFDEWTVESGLLTPTLKVRRPRLIAAHDAAIEATYAHRDTQKAV